MDSNKKLYLYSGVAIALAIVGYFVITRKKANANGTDGNGSIDNSSTTVTTVTGDEVSLNQATIPTTLADVLKKTSAQATAQLKNKDIYTKLDDIKVRNSNYVNNGVIDNVMSKVSNKNTYLGKVIAVVDDKGLLKNQNGQVIKWFKILPSQITLDDMNRNKSTFTRVFSVPFTKEIYLREDVVTLNKL